MGANASDEVNFSNETDAANWFAGRSIETRCAITSRATIRILSQIMVEGDEYLSQVGLPVFRALLTASFRTKDKLSALNWITISDAAALALPIEGPENTAGVAAGYASRSGDPDAENTFSASDAADSILTSIGGYLSSISENVMIEAVQWDANYDGDLFACHIWPDRKIPLVVNEKHKHGSDVLRSDPAWSFWLRFYEGMWEGTFDEWDLAFKVIKIDEEDWEKGYEHIGEVIAGIEARMRTAVATPLIHDSSDGQFHLSAEPALEAELLDFVRQRIGRALQAALEANKSNGFNESCYEAITIRLAMESTNPSAVAGLLYDASLSFQTSIGDLYPEDGSLVALRGAAFAGSEEICEGNDLARARCLRMAKLAQNPNAEDISDILEEFAEEIAQEGDTDVAEVLQADAALLAKMRNAPKFVRARFTNYSATIVQWIGKTKKGEGRVTWLVKTLGKILDWWQSGPPA